MFFITEVLCHRHSSECNTQTVAWWLVHLPKYKTGLVDDFGFLHFMPQIISFTSTLTYSGEYRYTRVHFGDVMNHFLDSDCLSNSSSSEYGYLTSLDKWSDQVNDFDARFEYLSFSRLFW